MPSIPSMAASGEHPRIGPNSRVMNPIQTLSTAELNDSQWDEFVAGCSNGHLLQTARWGRFKSLTPDWDMARVVVGSADQAAAGALILFRRLPLGQRLAYVPRGPAGPWWEPAVADVLFPAMHRAACERGAFLLKVEPEELDGSPAGEALRRAGFHPSTQTVQPRSTIWVDLAGAEDEIRARMKSKFRYNIGLAARKGVVVREGGPEDVPAFGRLMRETGQRDEFGVHEVGYYLDAYRTFAEIDACRLFLATYQERVIAGLMVFAYGQKAWYMYGASSDQERNRMPNHALQWAALQWARQKGCRIYDLWGIPDEVGRAPAEYERTVTERNDGLWGVYRFKQGFGGRVVRTIGAYDYVYDPLRYRLYRLALRMRRAGLAAG